MTAWRQSAWLPSLNPSQVPRALGEARFRETKTQGDEQSESTCYRMTGQDAVSFPAEAVTASVRQMKSDFPAGLDHFISRDILLLAKEHSTLKYQSE